MISLYLELFFTFLVIGMFTFGGGYAMLSLIQAQVVVNHAWISEGTFTDIVAISQMTPGPIGINSATYIGYEVLQNAGAGHFLSVLGSLTTTLALVLPSFIIMLQIVRFYLRHRSSPMMMDVMSAVRPAVVGLIAAAAAVLIFSVNWTAGRPQFSLVRENFVDWKSWLLLGGAFAASAGFKIHPILIIIAGGLLGLLLY